MPQPLSYQPMERVRVPRPVPRIGFIRDCCRDKAVLDLGAMDETAYQAKQGKGTWLHEEIASVAREVRGIDSSTLIPGEGLRTGTHARIDRGDIMQLQAWLRQHEFVPQVVIAGEIIEHLENPLAFLRSVKSTMQLQGKQLMLSTPNATALHNGLIGLVSRESTHHDHLCILSYKTLSTLCLRAGFTSWQIIPYYSDFIEMKARHSGVTGALVKVAERGINALEWCFPMLSFGYIVLIEI